jgi:histone deacetylase 6
MIVDWDVHHGDGTQAVVIGDEVLRKGCTFVSIHRHDDSFWPKSGAVGEGGDTGASIVNIPLRGTGFGNSDYFRVFEQVVLPLAARLEPDLVIVSAGYDCAAGDMIGHFKVTSEGFCWLTRLALGLARGASMLVLEGGYDVDGESGHKPLVDGVCSSIAGLYLGPCTINDLPEGWQEHVKQETEQVLEEVIAALSASK